MNLDNIGILVQSPYFGIAIFMMIVIGVIVLYQKGIKHFVIEKRLATSKVSTVTVGLVEVCGHIKSNDLLISPYFESECIGYSYKIEKDRKDTKNVYYHEQYAETKISPFEIGELRYSEAVINNNIKYLLLARAEERNGELVLCKDNNENIFRMMPYSEILQARKNQPFMTAALLYFLALFIYIALVVSA